MEFPTAVKAEEEIKFPTAVKAEEGNALLQATVVGQLVLVSPGRQIIYVKESTDHKPG